MDHSLSAKIVAANTALLANGELDAVNQCFAKDCGAYLAERLLLARKK